jgi:hypothetical protein
VRAGLEYEGSTKSHFFHSHMTHLQRSTHSHVSSLHLTFHKTTSTIITHHNPTPADRRRRPPSPATTSRPQPPPPCPYIALGLRQPPPYRCRSPSSTAAKRNQSTTIARLPSTPARVEKKKGEFHSHWGSKRGGPMTDDQRRRRLRRVPVPLSPRCRRRRHPMPPPPPAAC